MENIYMLSDADITARISAHLRVLRLRQNISRRDMAAASGVSVSSIARIEEGEIKSFESFLRVVRTLGKLEALLPLVTEEELSPSEYFRLVNSAKKQQRKRASKGGSAISQEEDSEW